jgi:hypothetical protein
VFEWKPKQLKLDIYPFLEYDIEKTLNILLENGFIQKFTADDNNAYGFVINFEKHQKINGTEQKNPAKYPSPTKEAFRKLQGSDEDELGSNEALQGSDEDELGLQEREREKEGKRNLVGSNEPTDDKPLSKKESDNQIVPVSPPKKRGIQLTEEQKTLFHAAKACFETSEKAKAIMYQDRSSTQMYMENLKHFVVRCTNIAPGITADFMRNVLEHFKVVVNGKLRGKVEFTPRALITPWVWETVISTLPEPENELTAGIRESIKGMFK